MQSLIKTMLEQGLSYKEISEKTKLTKATISYHAKKLGFGKPKKVADLSQLKSLYDSGLSLAECAKKLGVSKDTVSKAVKKGLVQVRSKSLDFDKMFVENSDTRRHLIKQRLLKEGILSNTCSECGLDGDWNGKPIVMVLDHINGVNNDNRIENLRMLCPNCNSQTPTFSGRNVKRNKE